MACWDMSAVHSGGKRPNRKAKWKVFLFIAFKCFGKFYSCSMNLPHLGAIVKLLYTFTYANHANHGISYMRMPKQFKMPNSKDTRLKESSETAFSKASNIAVSLKNLFLLSYAEPWWHLLTCSLLTNPKLITERHPCVLSTKFHSNTRRHLCSTPPNTQMCGGVLFIKEGIKSLSFSSLISKL